ncbi:MAG: hypothetical protein R2705_24625, partial [Ilumatobacteraceae bacterium]
MTRCAHQPERAEPVEVRTVSVDLDGDRRPDELRLAARPGGDGLLVWSAELRPATGSPSAVVLVDVGSEVEPVGPIQLHGLAARTSDPAQLGSEFLLRLGSFGDVSVLGVLGADANGCLFRFGNGLGAPLQLTVGEHDTGMTGVHCEWFDDAQTIVQRSAEPGAHGDWATTDVVLT